MDSTPSFPHSPLRAYPIMLLCCLVFLPGCQHLEPVERGRAKFEAWHAKQPEYTFMPGDELDVKLLYNPEFSDRVIVAPDGRVNLDMIGSVTAIHRTPDQLAADIRARYASELRHPEVSVVPRIFGSQAIYVGGEVHKAGLLKLSHGMSLMQGIMEAGGLLDTANIDQVLLIRRTHRNTSMLRTVNLKEILEGKATEDDIALQRFDVVFVPRSDIANADLWVSQHIEKLFPIQKNLFIGYYPGL